MRVGNGKFFKWKMENGEWKLDGKTTFHSPLSTFHFKKDGGKK